MAHLYTAKYSSVDFECAAPTESRTLSRCLKVLSRIRSKGRLKCQVSWTLRDAREGEIEATFPGLEVNYVVSDDSMSQVRISKPSTSTFLKSIC